MSSAVNVGIYVQPKTGDVSVTGNVLPSACNVYDLGSAERRWNDLYLSGNTIDLGGTKISRDANGGGIRLASASGETVDSRVKNLFADGTITASNLNIVGDYVTMRTTTSNTEMMVIENAGTGPALKVTQTGVNSIAEFYDDGGVLALKIADGGNVGIGTSAPLQKLHVAGDMHVGEYMGYANKLVPAVGGKINGVNITALNKRTRTSYAAAVDCVKTWTVRSSTADSGWNSICWSPELSLFVAVASFGTGRVETSPDGINWTTRTAAANNAWYSVCWSPELSLFVAVAMSGSGNRVMTSQNGISWIIQNSAANYDWFSVCWSPELSLFVAVAMSAGGIMTSSNGIDWTLQTSPATSNWWNSVCWSPELSLFVAVASYAPVGTNRVMISSNGINWTTRTAAEGNGWYSVCWSPELLLFVAVSNNGTNRVMTSSNGINWTSRAQAANVGWRSVCWSPELSIFVAVAYDGNNVMTSPDGINWTTRTSITSSWYSVCWSAELSIFVAVAAYAGNSIMTSAIGMPNAKSVVKALPSQVIVDAKGNVGIGTTTPLAKFHVTDTGAMIIPVGTDAQLPAVSVVGMIRYNLTSNRLQFYNGSVWNLIGGVIASGGTVSEITGYRVHTFTSSGTFTVQSGGEVEYLIVAGGGGGGFPYGGGGGAGGIVYAPSQFLVSGAHNVVIGAGGLSPYSSGSPYASIGGKGNNSSLITVIAEGGGGGSGFNADSAPPGASGGCGGGGSPYNSIVGGSVGGTGSQGGSGGAGRGGGPYAAGGGGGAAPSNGTGATTTNGGNGGNGFLSSLNGQIYLAGGGGGGIGHNTGSGYVGGSGGQGGGGTGSALSVNATSGAINTGGGGGGGGGVGAGNSGGGASGNGGSGIVIIRYRV